jgi:hypothetical protein
MAEGERATGTPNTVYDLSSVLFHALQAGASYDQYIQDAEEAGDRELAVFFRLLRDQDSDRAYAVRVLLGERAPTAERAEEAQPQDERERIRQEEREGVLREERGQQEGGGVLGTAREEARQEGGERREKGLLDRIKEAVSGPEDQRREGTDRR